MRKLILLFLVYCTALSGFGQSNIDIFTISGRFATPSKYTENYPGKGREIGAMINLKAPIVLSEKTIWYNNLTYFNFNVRNTETVPTESLSPMHLHGFVLQTGWYQKLKNNQGFQLLLAPRYMSDFNGSSRQSWQFGAIAMYERRFKDNLLMRFGALYNQELFGPNLVPLVDLYWAFGDRWTLSGLLPIHAKVTYQAMDNLQVGFSHFGLTTTYKLYQQGYENDYIERTSIDLALFARQKLFGNIYVEARFGHTLNRKYAQYADDQKLGARILIFNINDNRIQKNENFQNGFIGNVRLVYNIPI